MAQSRRGKEQQLNTTEGKRRETFCGVANVTLSMPFFSLSVDVLVGVYLLGKICPYTGVTSSAVSCLTDSAKRRPAADDRGRQEERDVPRRGQCDPVYAFLLLVCSCLSGSVLACENLRLYWRYFFRGFLSRRLGEAKTSS